MMNIQPKPNYFSIWRSTFSLFRRHAGLLAWATLLMVVPFFILNGLASARHMMTIGGANMMGTEVPGEQMRILWGGLVGGDSLASIALSITILLILKYLTARPDGGFTQHARKELPRLFFSAGFWLFVIAQVLVFAMINSPDGRLKILGLVLLGCSVLILLSSQDREAPAYGRRLRQLTWSGWLSLVFVVLTIPVLYILLSGYANAILLMLTDLGAQKAANLLNLDLQSPVLPYSIITVSKFLSQWLNLLPMALLLSTCLALRGTASEPASA
ncbi:MAG: hypothetical protein A3I66_00115 [Burkholderiales bacterium RIFCSPLOWO2_02_FULL_57_36]|nr:MAG: hypothetical protein A3I66_00115 [Burkholderiales bacterium RIFCSPLOWO2_02_FULL_57_36]